MKKYTKFCFITVNYNNSLLTLDYIKSINNLVKNQDYIKIIIVDNNSPKENEKENLRKITFENVEIIFNDSNTGYFSGLNKGLKKIEKEDYDYIIIGNNDITFDEEFLQKIKENKSDDDTLIVCPNILTKDGRYQNPMLKERLDKKTCIITKLYFFNYYLTKGISLLKKVFLKKTSSKKLDWENSDYIWIGIGACYILSKNFRDYIPKLDDRVFLWGEEALLANQVHSINKKVYYDKDIKIFHHESASVSSISSKKKYDLIKKSYKVYSKYL